MMNSVLTTKEQVANVAKIMGVLSVVSITELDSYSTVESTIFPELADVLRQQLHLFLVQNQKGEFKILCSDFTVCGALIPKIKKLLQDKKCIFTVNAVTDDITRHFSSSGYANSKNSEVIDLKNEQSISMQHLELLLTDSINCRASDIRFQVTEEATTVDYTVDKMLVKSRFNDESPSWGELIGRCIFSFLPRNEANQSTGEYNRLDPVNATFNAAGKRWRAGLFPADNGPTVLIRELGKSGEKIPSLEGLGFEPEQALVIRDITRAGGMVLVTGPTNSGKSTTLSSIVNEKNDGTKAIYTMEDPVERLQKGIYQATVDENGSSRTFRELGLQLLRQSPHIVIYGEIRTQDTAETAIRLATTGHLVCGTLHTASATGAVISLSYDLGIPVSRLCDPHLLRGSIFQRLMPKVCPHCALKWEAKQKQLNPYDVLRLNRAFEDKSNWLFINENGCQKCDHRGFKNLTVVAEVVPVDTNGRQYIKNMDSYGWEKYIFDDKGWLNIKQHALLKISRGEIDYFACESQMGDLTSTSSYTEFNPEAIRERVKPVS